MWTTWEGKNRIPESKLVVRLVVVVAGAGDWALPAVVPLDGLGEVNDSWSGCSWAWISVKVKVTISKPIVQCGDGILMSIDQFLFFFFAIIAQSRFGKLLKAGSSCHKHFKGTNEWTMRRGRLLKLLCVKVRLIFFKEDAPKREKERRRRRKTPNWNVPTR